MKEVEEVLTIVILKKLLKVRHSVKKEILLGCWHNPDTTIKYTDRLFVTKKGLLVKESGGHQYHLIGVRNHTFLINKYDLNHNKLRKIKEKLEEVYGQTSS